MTADDMVVAEIASGRWWKAAKALFRHANASGALPSFCGDWRHSAYPSRHATIWSQVGLDLPAWGTYSRRLFYGAIPCTRLMTAEEINGEYEYQTGEVIIKTFEERGLKPGTNPGGTGAFSRPVRLGKMPPMRCITPWYWKSAPIWVCSRASLRHSSLRCKTNCWISTTCVSIWANAHYGQ